MAGAQLRDTRRRIRSIEATKKITRAMELIAASRIPKAQARVIGSKPYTQKLIEVIENVGAAGAGQHELLERREVSTVGLLIVTSDRGLACAYATNIIRLAEMRINELAKEGKDVILFTVGKKALSYFRYRGYRIEQAFLGVTDTPGYGNARQCAQNVMIQYWDVHIDALEAFYTRYETAFTQTPVRIELLPITPPESWSRTNRHRRSHMSSSRHPKKSSIGYFPAMSRQPSSTCFSRPLHQNTVHGAVP